MKFGISEEDELNILKDWRDNYSYSKVPKNLQEKVKDQQAVDLLTEFTKGSEIDYQRISDRIAELEEKFQKQKEQSFWGILKKEFKEKTAKLIVWIIMSLIGFTIGILSGYFLK